MFEVAVQRLSLKILKLAVEMFAGPDTGFSGPQILDYFAEHSDQVMPYPWGGGAPSRRDMFLDSLNLLTPDEQRKVLLDLCDYEGPMKYPAPSAEDRQRLRELVLGEGAPSLSAGRATIEKFGWPSVNKDWQRAFQQIETDPEGAITAVRSLVESVCKHILDDAHVAYTDDGDLTKLYKAAAKHLNLAPEQHAEEVFRQILGGCTSVVNGLAGMRNRLGDSHGKGLTYVAPGKRHAKLAVTVGGGAAVFLLETYLERKGAT